MSEARLVAVLGYSDGRADGLHPVCVARLVRAEREVGSGDVVLLSGWARGRRPASEAELMAQAWNGRSVPLLLDRDARSTLENVVSAATAARTLAIREIVLVTSGWHGHRASTLLRAALRGSGRRVTVASTDEPATLRTRVRELACWALVPLQLRSSSRGGSVRAWESSAPS